MLEAKIGSITDQKEDLGPILDKAVDTLTKIDRIYAEANTMKKRELVGSIFQEKLVFDGRNYRTAKLNEVVQLIYSLDVAFRQKKMGQAAI